ncbi:MAG: DoxX family protein [Gemmatimonas sp.]
MSATIMQTAATAPSRRIARSVLAGRILSGIAVAFMLFDASGKILRIKEAVEGTQQLNFDPNVLLPLGLVQLTITLLYLVPRFAPLGATLLTGYLGGAVAIHVQFGNPLFTHLLFPIYVAVLLWGGLYLRDARVRAAIGPVR